MRLLFLCLTFLAITLQASANPAMLYGVIAGGGAAVDLGFYSAATYNPITSLDVDELLTPLNPGINDFKFNADGTRIFMANNHDGTIYVSALSTAYDPSTATRESAKDLDIDITYPELSGLEFNADFTKMFVADFTVDEVGVYDITAEDPSTGVRNAGQTLDVSVNVTNIESIVFVKSGDELHVIDSNDNSIHVYECSAAYDLSTASHNAAKTKTFTGFTSLRGLSYNNDGSVLYLTNGQLTPDTIRPYSLSTVFDPSTASFIASEEKDISANAPSAHAIVFNETQEKIFISEIGSEDEIVVYDVHDPIYSWATVGSSATIDLRSAVVAINSTDVAVVMGITDTIQTYRWNGSTWATVGNALSIAGIDFRHGAAKMGATRIVVLWPDLNKIRAYDFDGTDWAQVGNDFTIASLNRGATASYLSDNNIAIFDNTGPDGKLTRYSFDGTDFSAVGNTLTITSALNVGLIGLSATRVVAHDGSSGGDTLTVYDHDGTDWTQTGNTFNIGSGTNLQIHPAKISSDTIMSFGESPGSLMTTYKFDGTDFTRIGVFDALTDGTLSSLAYFTALDSETIAYHTGGGTTLRTATVTFIP